MPFKNKLPGCFEGAMAARSLIFKVSNNLLLVINHFGISIKCGSKRCNDNEIVISIISISISGYLLAIAAALPTSQ